MFKIHSCVQQRTGARHPLSEDRVICVDKLDESHPELSLYAVLDGHGDEHAAAFVQKHLPDSLKNIPAYAKGDYENAIRVCLAQLHETLITEAHSKGGTTISLALVDRRKMQGRTFLAFLGDSPIFIRRKNLTDDVYQAFPLHNSSNPAVASRNNWLTTTAPWESKRHPRGINLFGSLGDALYEPEINNTLIEHANTFVHTALSESTQPTTAHHLMNHLKQNLLKTLVVDSPVWRHAALHSDKTLAYYLSGKATEMLSCPLQRVPDVMSFATIDLDLVVMGSDGAFPASAFDRIMGDLKKVHWTYTKQDFVTLEQFSTQLITRSNSDDKAVVMFRLADCDDSDTSNDLPEIGPSSVT